MLPRCAFPAPGSSVAVAVSGGADSLSLLVLARAAGCVVTAYHVDHGLRAGSAAEAGLVEDAAGRFGAGFVGLSVEVDPGANLEARARRARYSALPAEVATGHTADDQAETVLINLLRGAGPDGLAGMRPGPRHPLLGIRRSETRALCAELGLQVVDDPTNADPRFLRNRVRHELIPLLSEIAKRDLVPVLCRQAGHFGDESSFLDELAAAVDAGGARSVADAPVVLARRAVRRWLREGDPEFHPPGTAAVERVLAVARQEVLACEIEGGRRVRRSRGKMLIEPPSGDKTPPWH